MTETNTTPLEKCPYSDGNSCEQYRLQGMRCQDCPLIWGLDPDGHAARWSSNGLLNRRFVGSSPTVSSK